MKRTTIFVPESLERDLQLYARREGKPAAAVVREAIAEYIAGGRSRTKLPSFAAAFDSGHTDTAERHEELLFERLSPHRAAASPVKHVTRPTPVRYRRRPTSRGR
jgi:hypothetical protein